MPGVSACVYAYLISVNQAFWTQKQRNSLVRLLKSFERCHARMGTSRVQANISHVNLRHCNLLQVRARTSNVSLKSTSVLIRASFKPRKTSLEHDLSLVHTSEISINTSTNARHTHARAESVIHEPSHFYVCVCLALVFVLVLISLV